ncbi:hypothetical protein COCCADRAFT_103132 [Bipolaris zeicola 26-R-13]|uniref:Uncharacterized protein n=1 Tax=Cochliobolus carbonum (strain 26-R-13) TaxID=930089 RepID=W6XT47_COCC2|nr:uncharacterized protein COCCADRAFT_103132 [Bipolaris zeicola 26-R-13]EUC30752.1 hypothetical protein COCCADRAFT_103132 [Bipolaris zeicola 26-R-13]
MSKSSAGQRASASGGTLVEPCALPIGRGRGVVSLLCRKWVSRGYAPAALLAHDAAAPTPQIYAITPAHASSLSLSASPPPLP